MEKIAYTELLHLILLRAKNHAGNSAATIEWTRITNSIYPNKSDFFEIAVEVNTLYKKALQEIAGIIADKESYLPVFTKVQDILNYSFSRGYEGLGSTQNQISPEVLSGLKLCAGFVKSQINRASFKFDSVSDILPDIEELENKVLTRDDLPPELKSMLMDICTAAKKSIHHFMIYGNIDELEATYSFSIGKVVLTRNRKNLDKSPEIKEDLWKIVSKFSDVVSILSATQTYLPLAKDLFLPK